IRDHRAEAATDPAAGGSPQAHARAPPTVRPRQRLDRPRGLPQALVAPRRQRGLGELQRHLGPARLPHHAGQQPDAVARRLLVTRPVPALQQRQGRSHVVRADARPTGVLLQGRRPGGRGEERPAARRGGPDGCGLDAGDGRLRARHSGREEEAEENESGRHGDLRSPRRSGVRERRVTRWRSNPRSAGRRATVDALLATPAALQPASAERAGLPRARPPARRAGGGATRRAARPGNGGSRPGAPGRRRAASYTRAATPRATARARVARHSTLSCSLKTTWREETAVGKPRILIADDQPDVLEALRLLLKAEGFEIELAQSPAGVLAALEARDFDIVLLDLNYTSDTT